MKARIAHIDGLRAVAVLMIVVVQASKSLADLRHFAFGHTIFDQGLAPMHQSLFGAVGTHVASGAAAWLGYGITGLIGGGLFWWSSERPVTETSPRLTLARVVHKRIMHVFRSLDLETTMSFGRASVVFATDMSMAPS